MPKTTDSGTQAKIKSHAKCRSPNEKKQVRENNDSY